MEKREVSPSGPCPRCGMEWRDCPCGKVDIVTGEPWRPEMRPGSRARAISYMENALNEKLGESGGFEVRDDGEGPYWFGGCPGDKDAMRFAVNEPLVLAPGGEAWPVGSKVDGFVPMGDAR